MLFSMHLASLSRVYLRRGAYGHGCRVAWHVEGDAVADLWDIAIMVMGEGRHFMKFVGYKLERGTLCPRLQSTTFISSLTGNFESN